MKKQRKKKNNAQNADKEIKVCCWRFISLDEPSFAFEFFSDFGNEQNAKLNE